MQPGSAATGQRHADATLLVIRLGGLLLFGLWVSRYMREPEPLLHGSLLIFHEAGHVLFMPFGEFMMVLGGSLFQLMVPAFFIAYFLHRRDVYAACFAGLYLAASLSGVAEYIADARAGALPLLGGDRANHDWTFLLIEMGRLDQDVVIGRFVHRVGVLTLMLSLAVGSVAGWRGAPLRHLDETARLQKSAPFSP
jgi:hypothetical protein